MRSLWTDSEHTLNVHWTCSEPGIEHWENWGKERTGGNRKKFKICVFFLKITINCTDLLLFAAFWTAFNVCSMLRSLYVHCMFNVSFSGRRPETETNLVLQETIHLWNHVPYTWHATYLDNPDWPDLSPSYASLCAGAWSMLACSGWVCWMWIWPAGQKQKEMLFRDGTLSKVFSLQRLQRQSCKGGNQNRTCYASRVFLHTPQSFLRQARQVPCARYELTVNIHWTYIEHAVNQA